MAATAVSIPTPILFLRDTFRRAPAVARWSLVGAAFGLLAGVTITVFTPRRWQSQVSFVPEGRGGGAAAALGRLGGVAGQLGIDLMGDATSPRFYIELLNSRTVREQVLASEVRVPGDSTRRAQVRALIVPRRKVGRPSAEEKAYAEIFGTRVQAEPRIVYITATTRDSILSADVVNAALSAIEKFDVTMRRRSAGERRAFLEQRAEETRQALVVAEDALERFLDRNRSEVIPLSLRNEQARLQRTIELRQQLYMNLAQQLEQARIDEVNERPRVSVIDRGKPAHKPVSRGLFLNVLAGVLLGGTIGYLAAFTRDQLTERRA